MAGSAASGPSSGRPPTGKIRVPTRADTSGEASRRWRTRISTSNAMASPPSLLALGLRGRLENGLAEHVPGLLHSPCANGVQRRTQPWAGRHLRRTSFVKGEIETPVSWANGKRRPVGPLVHQHPLDGPVSVTFVGMARTRAMTRCPAAGLLADTLGRYAGRAGDGCPLGVTAHTLEHPEHRLRALHFEADFHGPSLLHRRADQLQHFAPVIGANDVVPLVLVA